MVLPLFKNSLEVSRKVKHAIAMPSNSTPRYLPQKCKDRLTEKLVHKCVPSSFINSSQALETNSSTGEWINDMWNIHIMECYFRMKEE